MNDSTIANDEARNYMRDNYYIDGETVIIGCARPFNAVRFNVSGGNSKMGDIPSFSLLPTDRRYCFVWRDNGAVDHFEQMGSCAREACTGCKKACYAVGICNRSRHACQTYGENTALAVRTPERFENAARVWLECFAPRYFRIHVSGEFFSFRYFCQWASIATDFPCTQFFAYTKMSNYMERYEAENGDLPPNLHVNVSIWKDTVSNPTGAPTFEYDDGTDPTGETQALPHCPAILKPEKGRKKGKKREIKDKFTGEKRYYTCADCMICARMKNGDRIAVYNH